jgi:hypothetical protein
MAVASYRFNHSGDRFGQTVIGPIAADENFGGSDAI